MKWYAIAITICFLWLAFRSYNDKTNYENLKKSADSLGTVIDNYQIITDSFNRLSLVSERRADSLGRLLDNNIQYSINLKHRLNEVNTDVDILDSSEVFSELSDWLIRATGESLTNGN